LFLVSAAAGTVAKYLSIIKNQIQNPAPLTLRAMQGFGFYI
jgi:hypothetical protein